MSLPVLLISHGSVPTAEIPGIYESLSFECPPSITINMFETVGKKFSKNDACLLSNLLCQTYNENTDTLINLLERADGKKIRLPFATKDYYGRRYKPGDIVPNIKLTLEDPNTQLGLFFLKKDEKVHILDFDCQYGIIDGGAQLDINFDFDTDGKILGNKIQIDNIKPGCKPLWDYENKLISLSNVCKNIYQRYPKDPIELLVITCRVFENENITKAIKSSDNIIVFHKHVENEYDSLFASIDETVDGLNKLPQNLTNATLQSKQELEGYIRELLNTHPQVQDDQRNMIQTSYQNVFNNIDEIIRSVTNVPEHIKQFLGNSKVTLDKHLDILVKSLMASSNLIMEGYHQIKYASVAIALEDHLNKKPYLEVPSNPDYYIPVSVGNTYTRLNTLQNGGMKKKKIKKITSKKKYTKKRKNK